MKGRCLFIASESPFRCQGGVASWLSQMMDGHAMVYRCYRVLSEAFLRTEKDASKWGACLFVNLLWLEGVVSEALKPSAKELHDTSWNLVLYDPVLRKPRHLGDDSQELYPSARIGVMGWSLTWLLLHSFSQHFRQSYRVDIH